MKLTIVVCSLPYREKKLLRLFESLIPQITDDVELLVFSSYQTQGEKLNSALKIASGEYFCVIDDDDLVTRSFVSDVLQHTNGENDMIGYDVYCDEAELTESTDGQNPYRFIHHTYKRSLLKDFPDTIGVWDSDYVYSLDIKTWAWIHEQIYIYLFDPSDSAQMGNAGAIS